MSTLAELRTRISKRLLDKNNVAVSTSDVDLAINDAVDYWKQRRFWFNETSTTVVLTIDDPVIPMPADFLFEITTGGFIIDYAQTRWKLTKVNLASYELNNTEGKGLPFSYTYKGGQWLMYYYPDQAYNLEITYIKDYDLLEDDSDTNDFTNLASRLIEYDALSRLQAEIRQDEKMEAYYTARAENEANNLFQRANKVSGTGMLIVDEL